MEMTKLARIRSCFNTVGNFLYKYRYLIGIIFIVISVSLELNGSSIGCWNTYMTPDNEDTGIIWGESRGIRSDEWAVSTPFIFSQIITGFNWFTGVLRGGNTEAFTIYGLPIMKIVQIYRPFQLGYLFLGASKGLSLFWSGRFILLFLITFDFNMIITKKNRILSFIGAILVTLSSQVQWWFATNGMAELFIFGQLALISLYNYINTEKFFIKIICLGGMSFSAGVYILVLYPGYQIPLFFVFLALAVWLIIDNYKNIKIKKIDVLFIIIVLICFSLSIAYIIYAARDTIKILLNTAYPGARIETGGGAFRKYISYIQNIFFTFNTSNLIGDNVCEEAMMFGLFPIGIIITIINYIHTKKIDLLTTILLIPYVIIGTFCFIGFPQIIAKLLLLSYSTASRALIGLGYIDILLLIISLSKMENQEKKLVSIIIASVTSFLLVLIVKIMNNEYLSIKMTFILIAICIPLFYFALRFKSKFGKTFFTVMVTVLMVITGITVNPLRQGIDLITNSKLIEKLQIINNNESGTWMVVGVDFELMPNYLAMAGVPTLNCTNAYPNVKLWQSLDKDSKYDYIYNRYAHIKMNLVKSENDYDDKFKLVSDPDVIEVFVTVDELKLLNVKYIFVPKNLEDYSNENVNFEIVDIYEPYCIYKVNYNN